MDVAGWQLGEAVGEAGSQRGCGGVAVGLCLLWRAATKCETVC